MPDHSQVAPTIDWPTLLTAQHARFDADGHLLDFGDASAELHTTLGDGGIMPLPALGVIRVVGDDAAAFLQAQLSQGVTDQEVTESRLAGLCNPKGRLLAIFRVLRLDHDDFLLITHASLLEGLVKRLRMYVLRSRVALQDFTPHAALCGVTGTGGVAVTEATGTLPQGTGTVVHAGDTSVVNLGGEPERFLVIAHARDIHGLWEALTRGSRPVTPSAWELLAIRAGEPAVAAATSERFVPQQVNLELIGGVSFSKGCYPGQEVVARMHYRGTPSRRMFGLTAPEGGDVPLPGDSVLTVDGASAGEVVRAVAGPAGVEALAVLRVAYRDRQDLRLGGQPAGFAQLPYPVPMPESDEDAAEES
ncbi:folate-binding protein YgfZ [Aquisalimonas sp. 2447]|uniref:CAF17-like 4Fe-4S cluster assembly/insertion protein YgfZ n=1 Tax=Aquisalimonas sp. 2447 TaxID=2740807 RepID=UPI00143268E4|nr:folate-binding protein YgfZ [Aquisalimonas sp. 2447]QIT55454.1 folate-binding protein YgfZ [Aquisalimonas sp. 2447]